MTRKEERLGDLSLNFSRSEFRCKCGCGIDNVSPLLVDRLQELRTIYGKPLRINSGCRCPAHNAFVGGVVDSAHVATADKPCEAADLAIESGGEMFELLEVIYKNDIFKRIGVGKSLLHVDVDESVKFQRWAWPYTNK